MLRVLSWPRSQIDFILLEEFQYHVKTGRVSEVFLGQESVDISQYFETCIHLYTNLMSLQVVDHAGELGVSARRHGDVVDGVDELRDRGLHCNSPVSVLTFDWYNN